MVRRSDTKTRSIADHRKQRRNRTKARLVARIARLVRQAGLGYDDWRYVARQVRRKCDLRPAAKPKRLPRVLTADQFRQFYKAVDEADDVQHALMLRLLFYTAVGSASCAASRSPTWTWRTARCSSTRARAVKDRYVLFGKSFATALRTHIAAHPQNRWLFQTRRCGKFSTRRVEQIVKQYAEQAGIHATPHVFRHQCITFLTKTSGLADAELQLITGHARRETLAIYQHVAVDGQLADKLPGRR